MKKRNLVQLLLSLPLLGMFKKNEPETCWGLCQWLNEEYDFKSSQISESDMDKMLSEMTFEPGPTYIWIPEDSMPEFKRRMRALNA